MDNTDARPPQGTNEPRPTPAGAVRTTAPAADRPAPAAAGPAPPPPSPPPARPPSHPWRNWLLLGAGVVGLGVGAYFLVPWVWTALTTVSTDDAYVNGHVTFVAPRVAGQVSQVLVDDNYRVKGGRPSSLVAAVGLAGGLSHPGQVGWLAKAVTAAQGDVLVQLDPEPYRVQLAIKQAAVVAAEADLNAANAQVRGQVAAARASRFKLEHAIEDVNTQIANLHAAVATLQSKKATLELAKSNLKRGEDLVPGGISKEDLDQRRQTVKVDDAAVEQALQQVYAIRAGLGLPAKPPPGHGLDDNSDLRGLDENFSTVREDLSALLQSAAQFGYFPTSWDATPKQALADFYKQDPQGNLDRIYAHLIPKAPAIKQAEAKLLQAQSDLAQAELNLRYCDVVSEIDGVVTSRNVNPGNNVAVGQSLMAVRSLKEIWIDANFKETQLAYLRIGQRVRLEVDMYGSRREYEGYISGFTMGTGTTLALLPPQNATGNFVKIVQRLPVRIELLHYDPDKAPLFVGLSVVPYVYYKQPLIDEDVPGKGQMLQPQASLPMAPVLPRP